MFLGIIIGVTPTFENALVPGFYNDCLLECILYFVLPLISLAVSHFAYYLGSRDKKLFGKKATNNGTNKN
jgi:hypothetical protein